MGTQQTTDCCLHTFNSLNIKLVEISWSWIRQTWPRFRKRNKKSPSCVYLLHKASHQEILRHVQWQQRNVPKVSCTCRVVLLVKPFFFLSISLPSPSPSSLLLFNEKCSAEFLIITTSIIRTILRSLPSPKLFTVLTSIMQTPFYCGQLCLWSVPLTLVKPLPAKNSIVWAPRYIRESSVGSRESLPLQYGHLCINWFQRCQFTQSLPFNKDNAATRTPASVPVVSSVT